LFEGLPPGFLFGADGKPGGFWRSRGRQERGEPRQRAAHIPEQSQGGVIVGGVIHISVDGNNALRLRIAGARGIGLADGARAHRDEEVGVLHGVIAGQGAFGATDGHVLRVGVGDATTGDGGVHQDGAGALEQGEQFGTGVPSAAADLDDDALRLGNRLRCLGVFTLCGAQSEGLHSRQFGEVEIGQPRRLGVHRQQQIEGTGTVGMVHGRRAALQGGGEGERGVQAVGAPHGRRELQEKPLFVAGDLLHVEALILAGLIAEEVPDADAIGGGGERGGEGLQRARSDGGKHGCFFAGDPAQGGGGVRGFDLAANAADPQRSSLLVDAQHLTQFCGAVP